MGDQLFKGDTDKFEKKSLIEQETWEANTTSWRSGMPEYLQQTLSKNVWVVRKNINITFSLLSVKLSGRKFYGEKIKLKRKFEENNLRQTEVFIWKTGSKSERKRQIMMDKKNVNGQELRLLSNWKQCHSKYFLIPVIEEYSQNKQLFES